MLTSTDLLLAISAAVLVAALIWIRNERRLMAKEDGNDGPATIIDNWRARPGGRQ